MSRRASEGRATLLPGRERSLLGSPTQDAAGRGLVAEARESVGAVGRRVYALPPDPDAALGKEQLDEAD